MVIRAVLGGFARFTMDSAVSGLASFGRDSCDTLRS
jgi:hypothetical protein